MNFIENGSFESGDLGLWRVELGDPASIAFKPYEDGHVVRLKGGTLIAQDLPTADQLDPQGAYTLRVTTRAEPLTAAIVMLNAIFVDAEGNQRAYPGFFVSDSALVTEVFPVQLNFEHPIASVQVTCMAGGPARFMFTRVWEVNVWATGFELTATR